MNLPIPSSLIHPETAGHAHSRARRCLLVTSLHFLLSYQCTFECDHCFVYSGPFAKGTFTLAQIRRALDAALKVGSIDQVYFEGGEATLFYPLLIESIRAARAVGLQVGIVTNAFFATSEEDAELWLRPLTELGIIDLSISDDAFHSNLEESPAKRAIQAGRKLGLPVASLCIEKPSVRRDTPRAKGEPVVGGGVMFRGRAADKLTHGLPTREWRAFDECPHEELENPGRVHVDPYGNIHLCQGLSIGNMWQTELSELLWSFDARTHPICAPLIEGGPAQLVREHNVQHGDSYVDACHLCYTARKALLSRFPQYLTPRQVYGLE